MRKNLRKILVLFLIFSWIFSGWPQILNFPPEIKTAEAAFGAGGATCTNQSKTAGTSLTCTVGTENLDAGNIAVLWFAGNNIDTTDTNNNLLTSVTDSGSNTWTVQRCFTNGQGTTAAGATTCIATSKISTTLASGVGTITANFSSIAAKAIVTKEFTIGAGQNIVIAGTPQDLANDGADPGSMTISGLTSAEYLFVRGTALERANGGTWTITTGYTSSDCNGTTGGSAVTNMNVCGEFRILTGTGDTSDPTGTAVDNANTFIAFQAVTTTFAQSAYRWFENAPGSQGFGTGGVVIGAAASQHANAIAKDSTSMYVAGDDSSTNWRIEKRLLSGGSLVSGFGAGGVVTSAAGSNVANAIAIDSTSMYVAGYDSSTNWRIEKRLLSDGSLVSGFGAGGVVTGAAGSDVADAIAIDSTSMYVAGYDSTAAWRIEKRLLSDGLLVSGFGTGGVVTGAAASLEAFTIAIDSTSMYVAGYDDFADWRIEKRLLSDGLLVSGFGTGGVVTGAAGSVAAKAIAIDSTSMYVAGNNDGISPDLQDWRIEKRFLSDGSLAILVADVGSPLAAQDSAATLSSAGAAFRLRMLLHIGAAALSVSGQSFKLQFVDKGAGTCAAPSGGTPATYTDVTAATVMAYNDDAALSDGDLLTANAQDPTHGADVIVNQTYEELNNFTNSVAAIPAGQDGKWDFTLKDNGASASATYCFRAVKSDGAVIDTYTVRPEITTAGVIAPTFTQNFFRFYVNNDALDPTDPWPVGSVDLGENSSIISSNNPPASGEVLRIRMSIQIGDVNLNATSSAFKLQFAERVTTCSAISSWTDLGALGSGVIWRGFNAAPVDGAALSGDPPTSGALNLTVSDRAGTYEEANNTALNPFAVLVGEDVEYDWVIQDNAALNGTNYCFRMTKADGTALNSYNYYPTLITAGFRPKSQNWRWYDDETNETPIAPLAAENVAPADIVNQNIIKLRLTIKETAGVAGTDIKFKLQFSESSDFSSGVNNAVEIGNCTTNSLWCYGNGVDSDNASITALVLTDSTLAGIHNESGTSASTFDPLANAAVEYEFTIKHAGAQVNRTYFFRAFDVTNNNAVPLNSGETFPSLSTQGGTLTFSIGGLAAGTLTEGITTDVAASPTGITFGTLGFNSETEAAQRLTATTNATEGYQIFMFQRQGLISSGSSEITPVTGTNESPTSWTIGCVSAGCYGYHAGDDTLAGASTRFSPNDTYAKLETTAKEVAFNSGPVTNESTDVVFKTQITNQQDAGNYLSSVVYILVPTF